MLHYCVRDRCNVIILSPALVIHRSQILTAAFFTGLALSAFRLAVSNSTSLHVLLKSISCIGRYTGSQTCQCHMSCINKRPGFQVDGETRYMTLTHLFCLLVAGLQVQAQPKSVHVVLSHTCYVCLPKQKAHYVQLIGKAMVPCIIYLLLFKREFTFIDSKSSDNFTQALKEESIF